MLVDRLEQAPGHVADQLRIEPESRVVDLERLRLAEAHDAWLLGEPRGAPLLTMQRASYDDSGRVGEFADHAYRPQICSFEITLVNRY